MLRYPAIDPVALSIGDFKIHWYGLMYIFGLLIALLLGRTRLNRTQPALTKDGLYDLLFYCALGVILGGRIGYILFYDLEMYKANPLRIFEIWKGGMSFHGGMLGVILGMVLYAKRHKMAFWNLADFVAPLVPIGLGLGRIGNFINGELWGKPTDNQWFGMLVTNHEGVTQLLYPSQLYECFLEGIMLFCILWVYSKKPRPSMSVSGMFLFWYGVFRFIIEFVRVPDEQLGYLAFNWLTMGQILCLPMMAIGILLIVLAYGSKPTTNNTNI